MEEIEDLKVTIAGEITISSDPGKTMKKWREEFSVSQKDLAKHMGIGASIISDYENGRRKSPGSQFIRRFVDSLIEIDKNRGSPFALRFKILKDTDVILDISDFFYDVKLEDFIDRIDGSLKSNWKGTRFIRGYTVLDSIRAIIKLSPYDYFKVYGWTTERALFFTNVEYGRSPMIAVRVHPMKPAAVVYVQPKRIDELAIMLADVERIPLITTDLNLNELREKLRTFNQ